MKQKRRCFGPIFEISSGKGTENQGFIRIKIFWGELFPIIKGFCEQLMNECFLVPQFQNESLCETECDYRELNNNQINVRALIGQSAVGYCAGKPTKKSRVF